MRFLNPSAFYLLAVIPIVVLLHFLKLRRRRHVVPSVMLWLEAIEDMKANVPFQRLQNSILLPLQILFLCIAIGGVARPALRQFGSLGDQSLIVIDTSASMQAADRGKSRLDAAKVEALKLIDRLDADGQMMIMDTLRPPSHIRQAFTSDKRKLRQAIENLPTQHISSDLRATFDAVQVYASTPNTQVFFISDNFQPLPGSADQIYFQKIGVGEPGDNVAIVQFNVTRDLNSPNPYHVFVGLQSFADNSTELQVGLEIDGAGLIDDKTVVLPARETASLVFSVDDDERVYGQIISAHLDIDDDLSVDNIASAVLHPPPKWKVLLVSDRNQPLLTAILQTHPHVSLNQIQTLDYHSLGNVDIAIFDEFVPKTLPEGNIIFLNPHNGLPFMPVEKNMQPIRGIDQHPTHDVMRDVSLIDLEVKVSLRCQLPTWGIPLVETTQTPLIWLGEHSQRKVVVFAFDPFDFEISSFALFKRSIAAAPILMSQCLEWLGPTAAPIQPDAVKVGEPVKIRLDHPNEVNRVTVQLPQGVQVDIQERTSPITFAETTQIGIYTVFVNDEQLGRFAVNLLNAQESNLSPSDLTANSAEIALIDDMDAEWEISDLPTVNWEIWQYAAFFALLLLVVEWWIYHRNLGL